MVFKYIHLVLTYLILTTRPVLSNNDSDQSDSRNKFEEFNTTDQFEIQKMIQKIDDESVTFNFQRYWRLHDSLPGLARLSVRYSLMLGDIFKSQLGYESKPCRSNITVPYVRIIRLYDIADVTAECEESLELYDLSSDNAKQIRKICGSETVLYKDETLGGDINIFKINYLLPNQPYKFDILPDYNMSNTERITPHLSKFTQDLCTGETRKRPRFAPETDLGAFVIHQEPQDKTKPDYGANQTVDLYWRPLSPILTDSDDLNYKIICHNNLRKKVFETSRKHPVGNTTLHKPANLTFFCTIHSANSKGVSLRHKNILIPSQDNLIDLGLDFKFYVVLVKEGEFLIKWNPLEDYLIGRNMTEKSVELSTRGGNYTIYWCGEIICSSIIKYVVTDDTSLKIKTSLSKIRKSPRLGLSYKSHDEIHFSGIIWSKCITNWKLDSYLNDPLKVAIKILGSMNHNSLHIFWDFKGCDSIRAMIDHFEVSYLPVKKYDECSDQISSLDNSYVIQDIDCEKQDCRTIKLTNPFVSEATLYGLSSSTLYMIKMRCIYIDGMSNRWSRPLFATTAGDPEQVERCWRNMFFVIGLIFVILLGATAHVSYRSRTWLRHYYGVLFKYRNIKSDLSKQFGDAPTTCNSMNRLNTEHWFSPNIESQNSTGLIDSESSVNNQNNIGGELDFQQIPFENRIRKEQVITAYIPKALLETRIDQTTPEYSTEDDLKYRESTELDDISITSHTSFLQTIFDRDNKIDINNNLERSLLDLGTLTTARHDG